MVTCLSPSPSPYGFTVEPYCVYTRTFMLDSKQSLTMNRNRMPHQKHIIGRELTSRCTYSVYPTIRTGSQAKVCFPVLRSSWLFLWLCVALAQLTLLLSVAVALKILPSMANSNFLRRMVALPPIKVSHFLPSRKMIKCGSWDTA